MELKKTNLSKQLRVLNESKDSLGLKVGVIGVIIGLAGGLIGAYGPQAVGMVIFGIGALGVLFGFLFTFVVVMKKWGGG